MFYVYVLKLRSCMIDRRFASCQLTTHRHLLAAGMANLLEADNERGVSV